MTSTARARVIVLVAALVSRAAGAQVAPDAAAPGPAADAGSFERMTPEEHHRAAQAALSARCGAAGGRCANVAEATRHLDAIPADSEYAAGHRAQLAVSRRMLALAAEEDAAARERAALFARRGPAPRPTERGGNYREVRAYLRTHLDDFASYRPVDCDPPEADREGWAVRCRFRARNRLRATVLSDWVFLFVQGRVVYGGDGDPVGPTIAEAIGE